MGSDPFLEIGSDPFFGSDTGGGDVCPQDDR